MTPEQEKFLQGRLRNAISEQPELRRLKPLLLRFGGTFLVAPPELDSHVPTLLESGFVMSGPITSKRMRSSMCHQNVAAAWKAHKRDLVAVATGYALSEDGLWRQHSWGVLRNGLFETTEERVKYFGIMLQGTLAHEFADRNSC